MLAQEQGYGATAGRQEAMTLDTLRQRAQGGDARAQFRLGVIYEEGLGVKASGRAAECWYRRAAMQQDADAQVALAVLYAIGDSVERDYTKAYAWFDQAARKGREDALELRELVIGELDRAGRTAALDESQRLKAAFDG